MYVELRSSQNRTDMAELYHLVRIKFQQEHLQSIADSSFVDISEDALQRWRRHDTTNPDTIHLLQVAACLGFRVVWENDVVGINP